uniref:Hypothetical secreted peptide n=1 Tax=Glossina morsitans morsitans TaxID=37546 RepID=D3TST0_GLOMM
MMMIMKAFLNCIFIFFLQCFNATSYQSDFSFSITFRYKKNLIQKFNKFFSKNEYINISPY